MKKISIIIPCYNCEKTIDRCLGSVLGQSYKNIEIIAVNDGSKDRTLEMLKKYQKEYPNIIKIINKQNAGVSAARNDALRIATGDYIQFVDSDDNFMVNNALETNVELLEKNDVDMVNFNFIHPCFQTHLPEGIYDLTDEGTFKKYYQDFFYSSMPWNKLLKKEVITEYYDEEMAFAEDEMFNLSNLHNVKKVYINNEVLYNYYCAPLVNKSEASAINKIYVDDYFYKNKNTIWHKCVVNKIKRDVILKQNFSHLFGDMEFVRTFDFFFYDLAFMCHLNIPVDLINKSCVDSIVGEREFFDVLKSKEKYGLKLKSEKLQDLKKYMERFVELGSKAFWENREKNLGLKIYLVLFSIFAICFYNITDNLNLDDILVECRYNLDANSSKEAIYTNCFLRKICFE